MPETSSPVFALRISGFYGFMLLGFAAVLFPSLIRSIEHDFHQTDAGIGLLYLIRAVAFAPGALAGGLITERIGRRSVLVASALLMTTGAIVAAGSTWWPLFVAASAAASFGGAAGDSGINALFLDAFSRDRGPALNFLHLFFGIGALIGPALIGLLIAGGMPWRVVLLLSAIPSAVFVIPLLLIPMPAGRRRSAPPEIPRAHPTRALTMAPLIILAAAIALYTGVEIGVSGWLVRLLAAQPVAVATGVLSGFWLGLSAGRLASGWGAGKLEYAAMTIASLVAASLSLGAAVLLAPQAASFPLFALCGFFLGPAYPMIMAIAGGLYPDRPDAVSGGLTTAAAVGIMIYPPLMGFLSGRVGLSATMLGAAILALASAGCIVLLPHVIPRRPTRRSSPAALSDRPPE